MKELEMLRRRIKGLIERYTDSCSMCTDFNECETCDIAYFIEDLKELYAINLED